MLRQRVLHSVRQARPTQAKQCAAQLPERLLKPFYRHRKGDFVTIAKTIGNCLGNSENLYRNAFYGVGFDTFVEQAFSEAHYANRASVRLRSPILATYRKPHVSRQLISQAVEREGRDEAQRFSERAWQPPPGYGRQRAPHQEADRDRGQAGSPLHPVPCGLRWLR